MTGSIAAATVLGLVRSRPPSLGTGRLVCVEGPAGSGKTTLAAAVEVAAWETGMSVATVHTDDLLVGWRGLPELGPTVLADVVVPLAAGRAGRYRRFDWLQGALAGTVPVPVSDLLLLEGVGSGHLGYADLTTATVWVEAPPEVRRARGLTRDGEDLMPDWDAFAVDEDRLHRAERTRERADLVIDGLTSAVTELRSV